MQIHRLAQLMLVLAATPVIADEPGHLIIVGGGGTPDTVLKRTVELAGGAEAKVVILPQASMAENRGKDIMSAFAKLGVAQVHIVELDDASAAKAMIAAADLIWFPGGQQSRLINALNAAGVADTIRQSLEAGVTIGGTSAGAAVMSDVMITALPDKPALRVGNTPRMKGLGLAPELIIDQHFVERRRMNRLVSAVLEHKDRVGVGISEQTAILVADGKLEVSGKGSVVIIDARQATTKAASKGQLQTAQGVEMHVLKAGGTFHFRNE